MAKKNASVVDVFEGFVRHTCGWVNVKGKAFVFASGCPKCGDRIIAVEKLSDAEVKELGLKKLSGAALDRAVREQKGELSQQTEELEDDEDEDDDESEGDDDSDYDDGDEGDDDSESE